MMVPIIQIALFAGAFAIVGEVLGEALADPRFRAVLRHLLTGREG